MEEEAIIDKYLLKPYWIIDVLPMQVPAHGRGQYFRIEEYVRHSSLMEPVSRKFFAFLLKINCYEEINVFHLTEEWVYNPAPERMEKWVMAHDSLQVLLPSLDALISISGDDTYLTFYTSDENALDFIRPLAVSVGLFVWRPKA